jgi:phasin
VNTHSKPKSGNVENVDAPRHVRDLTESAVEQSREGLQKINSAATEAAEVMKNSCSAALKGLQEYNGMLLEFTQANLKSHVELVQKLASVKSLPEYLEISTEHARSQFQRLAEQTKELSTVAQQTALASAEPLKAGFAKVQSRAA